MNTTAQMVIQANTERYSFNLFIFHQQNYNIVWNHGSHSLKKSARSLKIPDKGTIGAITFGQKPENV